MKWWYSVEGSWDPDDLPGDPEVVAEVLAEVELEFVQRVENSELESRYFALGYYSKGEVEEAADA